MMRKALMYSGPGFRVRDYFRLPRGRQQPTCRGPLSQSTGRDPAAILIGGDANAVSVARSLGRRRIAVHALGAGGRDPVRDSRHCHEYIAFERDSEIQARWLEWLDRSADRLPGAVLLSCNDEALELVARNRARLVALGYRPFEAEDDVVLTMLDKRRTYELAALIGVPAPRTLPVAGARDVATIAREIGFPCALKPLHSHELARHAGMQKVFVVEDANELRRAFQRLDGLGVAALATEIIPGDDEQFRSFYSYIDERGEPLVRFCKQKLRGYPPGFGLTSYHISIWDDEVAELGLRFFQGAGVRGVANVEFKRDPRDGVLKLIECNHRFTAANELVRLAGIDLALLSYNRALGRPSPPMEQYRTGVRLWDPILDIRALAALRAQSELSVGAWLRSLLHAQHLPLLRASDPAPGLVEIARRAVSLRAKRRTRPRDRAAATVAEAVAERS